MIDKKYPCSLKFSKVNLYMLCRYGHIPLKKRVKIAQNWYDGICQRATPLKWKTK